MLDYSTKPIDIVNKDGAWLYTYRYEPYLHKWYFIKPDMKAELILLEDKDVPEIVKNECEKKEYPNINSYINPIKVQIQINKKCNCRCKMCYASSDILNQDEFSIEDLEKVLLKLKSLGVIRINYVGGEPFFKKDFIEICQLTKRLHLLYSFITNAIIPGNNMEKYADVIDNAFNIQVSCNGYGNSYLNEYGISNWELAKRGMTNVVKRAKTCIMSYVITESNYQDIPKFMEFANEINPTVIKFGSVCFSGRAKEEKGTSYYKNIIPIAKSQIENMREKYPHLKIQSQLDMGTETPLWEEYSNGYRPFEFYFSPEAHDGFYINAKGVVYPFPLLSENEEFIVGNIKEDIEKLWQTSEVFNKIREVKFKETACGKLGCKKVCGLWTRSYAYAWSKNLLGKVPCELTDWK